MPTTLSHHAARRCQQRAIPLGIVDLIYAYGTIYQSRAATGYIFDREALNWAIGDLGNANIRVLERYLGTYLIMGDAGVLITAARQTRRRLH
jgi:hypothetical protein